MLQKIYDWLIPIRCLLCQSLSPDFFCLECLQELPWIKNPCELCGKELTMEKWRLCGECLIHPPPISKMLALCDYKYPLISLITGMKFCHQIAYAKALGKLLAQKIQSSYLNEVLPEVILPVPLHRQRLITRGYNQALEIARPINKQLSILMDYKSLQRILPTKPQTLVSSHERKHNVQGAFTLAESFSASHVAVVDDVITTFSTLLEISNVLKKHGVERIDIWCIARA